MNYNEKENTFNKSVRYDCPCWNCTNRGIACKTCSEGKAWREYQIKKYNSKIPEYDFNSYVYGFRNKYLHRQQRKGK